MKAQNDVQEKEIKKKPAKSKVSENKLDVLITVVNRNKAEFYTDIIQSFDVNMQMTVRARGTANKQMLSYLGLEESDKAVIFSIIKHSRARDALDCLEEKFGTIKNGGGISFTVSMTSIIGTAVFGFLSNNRISVKEKSQNEKK